jgi:hypothetical protein
VTVQVPQDTFPVRVQVTITEPFSEFEPCQGDPEPHIRGFHLIGGVGILVDRWGAPFGRFSHPISVSMRDVGRTDFSNIDVVSRTGRIIIRLSGAHTRYPWKVSTYTSTSWTVLGDDQLPPPWFGRHGTSKRHSRGFLTTGLTAALLPAGLRAPGLGVLTAPDAGLARTAGGQPADRR